MQVKHQEKKKLKQEIKTLSTQLKIALSMLVYTTLLHRINIAVKSRIKSIAKRHEKKLSKFKKRQQKSDIKNRIQVSKNTIQNFSSYTLSDDEIMALNYGLDQHIPYTVNYNSINTEFELFYQNILRDTSHIPEQNLAHVKTKLRSTCEKYCKIKVPFKRKEVIKKLSSNNSIVILKQDKGRGVVIMNRSAYLEKCFTLLNNSQFNKLTKDPTHATERKIQRVVRKMKLKLPSSIYSKIYPTGSAHGKFYGTAKIHKLSSNDTINELPLRPIASNIGTATYHLSKYLAKFLSPLSESEYTIKNTKYFVDKIKKEHIPNDHLPVSFDVKSLFTNVPLDETIAIILNRTYDKNEISTDITKSEMKELLNLCTKSAHFTFDGNIYVQNDGVAMGSPLGPVLANIFMVELERSVITTLMNKMKCWTRYVNDTLCYIKTNSIDYVLKMLNGFHRNIQFTYEVEIDLKISFLDVLVIRDSNNNISTTVYRKSTNIDIYLNWESFAPDKWKWGTLKTLTKRAYDVCSNQELLQKESNYIEKVFRVNNNYPNWVIKKVLQQAKQQQHQPQKVTADTAGKNYFLLLSYKGEKGEHLIKSMKRKISELLLPEFKTQVTYTGKKLGNSFM